jgi:hypothetical protein
VIRFIVRRDNANMAANVGGAVLTTMHTVDADVPELERILVSGGVSEISFEHTQLIGAEILIKDPTQ